MTLLVNFVSMSVHLRSAKEGPSIMRRTCICRGNEQQSLLLPRVSCPCSSHAEDEYAASRAAKAGFCLVPALVSLSVQIFPTESFIVHIADLSAWGAHRRAIGRYIGGAPINCAPTRYYRCCLVNFIIGSRGCYDIRMKKLLCITWHPQGMPGFSNPQSGPFPSGHSTPSRA